MNPMISSKDNAEHYKWGNNCDGWHLAKSSSLSVIQEMIPPGQFELSHYHERSEQYFYVLPGVATMEVNGHVIQVNPGSGVYISETTPHQIMNKEDTHLEFLLISTPPINGDRINLVKSAHQIDSPELLTRPGDL
jgi:mannose-6-phosphate isomerase-like protein (cupin superfamily)